MSLAFQRLASLQGHHPNSYSSTADLMVGSNSPFLSPPMSSPAMVNMTNQLMTSEALLQLSMLNSSPFLSSYSHSPLLNTSPYYTQTQHYPVMPFNFSNSGSTSLLPSHSSLLPPSYMNLPSHHAPDLSFSSAPHFLSFASKPLDSKENPLASAALVLSSYNKDDNLSVTTHASETDRDSTAPENERRPKTTKSSTSKDKSPKPGECRNRCVIFCGRSEPGASPDEQPVFQAEALCKPLGQCLTLYTTEPEGKSQQKLNLFAAGDVARVLACSSHMLAMYLRRRRTQVDSGIYQATKVSHRREAFKGARSNAYFLTEEACASFKQHCEQRRTRESEKGK